jgi:serine/threonine protein kinase
MKPTGEPPQHPHPDELRAFGVGKLDPAASDTVVQHLETCVECRKVVAETSGDQFLERLRAAQPSIVPSVDRTAAYVPAANAVPPELADNPEYENLVLLGSGGMGVVYKARNTLMDREEVLKVMNRDMMARPGAIDRFRREVQSAARLDHPNIVRAYTARLLGDLMVFTMEFVPGEELGKLVKARGPLPILHACNYAQQIAAGLQHAHEKGMVHRDIKPANLILRIEGKKHTIKVLDFGLAKLTSERGFDAGLTGEGRMLGTPDYIAPEQIRDAHSAGIRADIYSLGCTLYYLLTGRPPFAGNLYELLRQHQEVEPEPVTSLRPDIPDGLAAVVVKMMAKEPGNRYQTPMDVVKALAPFAKPRAGVKRESDSKANMDRPAPVISPLPEQRRNMWETLVPDAPNEGAVVAKKKPRRSPATLIGLIAVGVLVIGALLTAWAIGLFRGKDKDVTPLVKTTTDQTTRTRSDTQTVTARTGTTASPSKSDPTIPKELPEPVAKMPPMAKGPPSPRSADDIREGRVRAPDMSKAEVLFSDTFVDPFRNGWRKGTYADGGFERTNGYKDGRYFIELKRGFGTSGVGQGVGPFRDFACELHGRLPAEPLQSWGLFIKHVGEGEVDDPKSAGPGVIVQIDNEGQCLIRITSLGLNTGWIAHSAIKKGTELNRVLVVVKNKLCEIYVNSVAVYPPIPLKSDMPGSNISMACFAPVKPSRAEFERIAVMSTKALLPLDERFDPDGLDDRRLDGHTDHVFHTAFVDQARAVSASVDGTLRLWNLRTGEVVREFSGHTSDVFWVAVSTDGTRLLSASKDNTARLWDLETGNTLQTFKGHAGNVYCAIFAVDGKHAYTCSHDQTIRKWDLASGAEVKRFDRHAHFVRSLSVSPKADLLVSGSGLSSVHVWDTNSGKIVKTLSGHTKQATGVAFAPDGQHILSASHDGTVRLWDWAKGKLIHELTGHKEPVHAVAFSPDGRRALSGSYDRTMILWDLETGQRLQEFTGHDDSVFGVDFSPKGTHILSASKDKTLRLWRLPAK